MIVAAVSTHVYTSRSTITRNFFWGDEYFAKGAQRYVYVIDPLCTFEVWKTVKVSVHWDKEENLKGGKA